MRRPDPTWSWYVRVLYSTDQPQVNGPLRFSIGLNGVSLVRTPRETSKTIVVDALEGRVDGCLLGEPIDRWPELPRPAPPIRRASLPQPARALFEFWFKQVWIRQITTST